MKRGNSVASMASVASVVSDFSALSAALKQENSEADNHLDGLDARERRRILSSPIRNRMLIWITSELYTKAILCFVFLHVSVLILSSIDQVVQPASIYLEVSDIVILAVLVYDVVLKISAWQRVFFTRFILIVDLLLVLSDILVLVLPHLVPTQPSSTKTAIQLLTTTRSIRLLWSISHISHLKIIVSTLLKSSRYL